EVLMLLLVKKHEHSECIIHVLLFESLIIYAKNCPHEASETSFNRVRALASTKGSFNNSLWK
ncbi:hypothetical protein, partial [Acinetobacter baumannii]|uniref:hypothetical protein n=1 Tax=Acinetobacter baumannii TaxID=470 RepID=UPI003891F98A